MTWPRTDTWCPHIRKFPPCSPILERAIEMPWRVAVLPTNVASSSTQAWKKNPSPKRNRKCSYFANSSVHSARNFGLIIHKMPQCCMIELVMILCTERYAVSWPKWLIQQIFRSRRLFVIISYFYHTVYFITFPRNYFAICNYNDNLQ